MNIEYDSVFEAVKGNRAIERETRRVFERDHNYGVLKFEMNEKEVNILRANKIGFVVINE